MKKLALTTIILSMLVSGSDDKPQYAATDSTVVDTTFSYPWKTTKKAKDSTLVDTTLSHIWNTTKKNTNKLFYSIMSSSNPETRNLRVTVALFYAIGKELEPAYLGMKSFTEYMTELYNNPLPPDSTSVSKHQ